MRTGWIWKKYTHKLVIKQEFLKSLTYSEDLSSNSLKSNKTPKRKAFPI
jgi:hypothetical protein